MAYKLDRLEDDLLDAEQIITSEAVELTERGATWWKVTLDRLLDPWLGKYVRDDPGQYSWMVRNSANCITLSRGLLTLLMLPFMLRAKSLRARIAVSIMAGLVALLDLVDGGVARKLGITSTFGKAVDPLMDKLFYIAVGVATVNLHADETGRLPRLLTSTVAVGTVLEIDVAINGTHQGILAKRCDRLDPSNPVELTGATGNGKVKFLLQVFGLLFGWITPNKETGRRIATALLGLATIFSRRSNHDHREAVVKLQQELLKRKTA
jgi:phosphatidylglycerophosphate synthase